MNCGEISSPGKMFDLENFQKGEGGQAMITWYWYQEGGYVLITEGELEGVKIAKTLIT